MSLSRSNYSQINITTFGLTYHAEGVMDGLVQMLGSTLDAGYQSIRGQTYDSELGVPEGTGVDYTLGFLADKTSVRVGTQLVDYFAVAMLADVDGVWRWGGQLAQSERDYSRTYDAWYSRDGSNAYAGSYLVRETNETPEPTTLALLGLALAGLGATRRKKAV